MHEIWHKHVFRCLVWTTFEKFGKKSKNQVTASKKHRKIAQIFISPVTFSFAVIKWLKLKKKWKRAFQWDRYTFQKMYLRPLRTVWCSQSWHSMESVIFRQCHPTTWRPLYLRIMIALCYTAAIRLAVGLYNLTAHVCDATLWSASASWRDTKLVVFKKDILSR